MDKSSGEDAEIPQWLMLTAAVSLLSGILSILAGVFLLVLALPVGDSIVKVDKINDLASGTLTAMVGLGCIAVVLGALFLGMGRGREVTFVARLPAHAGILLGSLALAAMCFVETFVLQGKGLKLVSIEPAFRTCKNDLRQVAIGMQMYRDANSGEMPPDLQALYGKDYMPDARILVCPSREGKTRLDTARLDETGDYY